MPVRQGEIASSTRLRLVPTHGTGVAASASQPLTPWMKRMKYPEDLENGRAGRGVAPAAHLDCSKSREGDCCGISSIHFRARMPRRSWTWSERRFTAARQQVRLLSIELGHLPHGAREVGSRKQSCPSQTLS